MIPLGTSVRDRCLKLKKRLHRLTISRLLSLLRFVFVSRRVTYYITLVGPPLRPLLHDFIGMYVATYFAYQLPPA
jgi:hypothetical protein